MTNWGGNLTYSAREILRPASVDELQRIVRRSDRVHVLGTRHSFSPVADTSGELLVLSELPRVLEIDTENSRVRVSGATRYGELAGVLNQAGFALRNLGSLPHISVAGACSTGTHGSGDTNKVLADSVSEIELVAADGELITIDRMDEAFRGSVIALGSLGAVVTLTLDLVPSFEIRQYVYENLPLESLIDNFDEVMSAAYSVSVFTLWRDGLAHAWLKSREPRADGEWLGGHPARTPRHPLPTESGEQATQQLGVPGPWHERLPHFRLEFTPSHGEEIQSEYLLPRAFGPAALRALSAIGDQLAGVLLTSEVRTVAADDLWLSCAYDRDSVALHFTWALDIPAVNAAVSLVEKALAPFEARPHWGKVFGPTRMPELFPRLGDFARYRVAYDPTGKFSNDFIIRYAS
jgi:alditol oxidase